MFIAEMAVKACEIKHGGGGHWSNFVSQHTLKDFANEIGMHQKTLYEWVAAKRNVVDKLPPKLAVEADEADLEDLEIILNGAIDCVAYLKTYVKVRKRKEGVRE